MSINLIRKPYSPLGSPLNKFILKSSAFVCVALVLGACERPVPRVSNGLPLPAQTYDHVKRLPLRVGNVQILRDERSEGRRVGDFSVSLHDQAMLYLSKKFETRGVFGDTGQLVVKVEDVHVEHRQSPSNHSVLQRIGIDRVNHYDLGVSIRLEHRDDAGRVLYGKVLSAEKKLSISEHLSMAAREQAQFDAVEDMFVLLDPQVNRVIRNQMNLVDF